MSTPVAPASAPSATTHGSQGTQARGQGRPHGSPAGGHDLFAQLMLLMGGDADAPAAGTLLTAPSPPDTADGRDAQAMPEAPQPQHPLAGLLGWYAGAAEGSPVDTRSDTAAMAERPQLPEGADPNDALAAQRAHGANSPPAAGLPAGLQRLDNPEAPDARTLAALDPASTDLAATSNATSRADAPATNIQTTAQNSASPPGRSAARLPAWRSTTALGQGGAIARPNVQVLLRAGDGPAQTPFNLARSTVQLDERFTSDSGQPEPSAGALAASVLSGTAGAGVERAGTAPAADSGVSALGETSGADHGTDAQQQDAPGTGEQQPDAARADEAADAEATGWSAQQLRQASLRVDAGDEGAIDIQLSLQGQEVQVAFRSDDAQTRASLAQESATLDELLQRSGMALGGVSVGSQGTSTGSGGDRPSPARPHPPAGATARPREALAATPTPSGATAPAPRRDGSQPLDLFV